MILRTKHRAAIFFCFCILIAGFFLWRIFLIAPLYLDSSIRAQVRTLMQNVANENGWVLSDLSMKRIDDGSVTLVHRTHMRGDDSSSCYVLSFTSTASTPCNR